MGTFQDPLWVQNTLTYTAAEDRYLIAGFAPRAGVLDSVSSFPLNVGPSSGLTISVQPGIGIVRAATGNTQQAYLLPHITSATTYTLPASPSVNPRYDVVVLTVTDTADGDGSNAFTISHVSGAEAATPLFPTIPLKSVALAAVMRTVGQVTVSSGNIFDIRNLYSSGDKVTRITVASAATARASTTTMAVDPWLTVGGLQPGGKYKIKMVLFLGGEDAGDFKYQFQYPAGSVFTSGQIAFGTAAPGAVTIGSADFFFQHNAAGSSSATYTAQIADTFGVMLIHEGIIDLHATTGIGRFDLWWAQNTSNVTATTVYQNSHIECTKVF